MSDTNKHTESADAIRKNVSEAYARAVIAPAPLSGGVIAQKGVAAQLAGYSADQLSILPADAVQNSFGCGNPLAHGELAEGEVVVDLGSGAGIDVLLAAEKVGPTGRVIGIDMTDEMIDRARHNIAEAGVDHVEVRKGLIEQLPVDDASVDWVLSNCVINLSPEKPRVFAEIARVLKPGGRMLVSDVVAEDLPDWVRQDAALYNSCVAGAISEADYLQGLRDAGLVDVAVRDRLVYDESQLAALAADELEGGCCGSSGGCCGTAMSGGLIAETRGLVEKAAADLTGKVSSIKVYARKP